MWDVVHKVKPTTKGYQWFYYSEVGDTLKVPATKPRMVHRKNINTKEVYCYTLNGTLYKVYKSPRQAAEEIKKEGKSVNTIKNIQATIVRQCDLQPLKKSSSFGYQWSWQQQKMSIWEPEKEKLKGIRPEIYSK